MKAKAEEKTNVMRLLDAAGEVYGTRCYEGSGAVSGTEVAAFLGEDPEQVFKTLVTVGHSGGHYVFVIPSAAELDLKKAAAVAGEKSVAMLKQKELLPLTGYVHGGCSPIGMKRAFPTYIEETAALFDTVFVSAGRIGYQLAISPEVLLRFVSGCFADLC